MPSDQLFRSFILRPRHLLVLKFTSKSPNRSSNHLSNSPKCCKSPLVRRAMISDTDVIVSRLDIFSPHRHQCGLEINMQQLRDSLSLPTAEQRHPALLHAIFLWACFVSRPEPLCQHEEHYLARALEALNEALRLGDRVIDVIQASCLISLYFLASGRILEGSYHASAAAALAVQCGLHGGISREGSSWLSQPTETFGLRQTKSGFRDGERILAFWQVYNLDRCWSVVLHKPSIIPDGPDAWNSINCPWPQNLADYQSVSYLSLPSMVHRLTHNSVFL
jgi:hypothetical protein